jgi:hypothetical protein
MPHFLHLHRRMTTATPRVSIAARMIVGAQLLIMGGCGQSADDRPTSWSYISTTIVQPNCATANCHATITQRAGLDLSKIKEGYESLVGQQYVIPADPAGSPLPLILRGVGIRRMPPDFGMPEGDIELIERWIAAHAPYDGPGSPAVPR